VRLCRTVWLLSFAALWSMPEYGQPGSEFFGHQASLATPADWPTICVGSPKNHEGGARPFKVN
jgi:hypothetical protein